jgi:hypothetical protein
VIPKLMGAAIAVHPLLVIFGILAGAQIMGIGGVLLALPLLAVGREIVVFLRERIALGSWPAPIPSAVFAAGGAANEGAAAATAEVATAPPGAGLGQRIRAMLRRRDDGDDEPDGTE